MEMFLNIGLAQISTILAGILAIVYVLRVVNKKAFNNKNSFLSTLNKMLRKHHKLLGIILVITGLVHGIYSSESVLSFNLGTVTWVLSLLLGISYMMRKQLKGKGWMYYHRILTVLFLGVLVAHIATVKLDEGGDRNPSYINQSTNISNNQSNISSNNSITSGSGTGDDSSSSVKVSYKDGTYTGEGNGYRPGLNVSVTIKNNKITDIQILDNNETPKFLNRVSSVITNEIIESQSVQVDTVSGATRSSRGIMQAVQNALASAKA